MSKIGNTYRQKGVDGLLIEDLLLIAQRREVEKVILVVADTDFVGTINTVKENYGLKVIIAYYTDRQRNSRFSMSNHLLAVADDTILIEKEHFLPALK